MIWKQPFTIEGLNALGHNSLSEFMGIEFTEYGDDYLIARMPVDHRTVQPFRVLHGGASAALAETAGSIASFLCLEHPNRQNSVGIELNISHLSAARGGFVYATVRPYRLGRRLHVWNIEIKDEKGKRISVSRLTMAIVERD